MTSAIIRMTEVLRETGYSKSTLYWRIAQGFWPKPVSLGARAVGWPKTEVDVLNRARIAGRTADDIRALVDMIHKSRRSLDIHIPPYANGEGEA